ncbi:crosslink repair DNA glycosylase YcaQ family protein [Paenibacillus sp. FSL R5-0887]|uniref:DNA glycosylase AlkZ-like family protein n=1 Tax=Paenibacillus sp. FSL R5-0887 TaxID=2921662 RepID=UPI0030FA9718
MTNKMLAAQRLYNQKIVDSKLIKPEQVVKELGAVQAQDYMQAMWAIGLRTPSSSLADIERAIADRKMILNWTLRGTLHFVPPEDVKWMHQLSVPRLAGQTKRRNAELGLDDQTLERCRHIIVNALQGGMQLDRALLLQLIEEEGIHTGNQRGYHMLWNVAYQGLICFGPMNGKQQTIVLLEEWVPQFRELLDLCQESGQSRNRHSSQLLSKTNWRKIPQRAMHSLAVIVKLNILKKCLVGLLLSFESRITINELLFQNAVPRLDTGVIITVTSAAHAGLHAIRFQLLRVFMRSILRTSIGVM